MTTDFPGAFENPDDFRRLRDVFESAGYTDAGILTSLGVDSVSLRESDLCLLLHRTSGARPIDTLIRLFLMEMPVETASVMQAVAPVDMGVLLRAGLLECRAMRTRARVKILPYKDILFAFDVSDRLRSDLREDYVMGVGRSSISLANVTVRRSAGTVLDLGCGCGIQALTASRHSERVFAVDRNPRAVRMAAFNAALNGIPNVQCRRGNLLEPVREENFDLIVSNPPFVISPESRYIYRDGGMEDDLICRKIVREAPRVLREGGFCQILCNWVEEAGRDWRERLAEWFEGTGCDAWVMRSETHDAATYASKWIAHTEKDVADRTFDRFEEWLDYYEKRGIASVGSGVITMRRSGGRANWFRADDGPDKMIGPCGDSVARGFLLRDFLEAVKEDGGLLETRVRLAPEATLDERLEPSPEGWMTVEAKLCLGRGLTYSGRVDTRICNLLIRCNGERKLRDLLTDAAGSLGVDGSSIESGFCDLMRSLIERGFLLPDGVE